MDTAILNSAAVTDVGRQRDHNEDNYLINESIGLFVVCDGMGGHAAGEVASAIAVQTIEAEIRGEEDILQDYVAGKQGAARVSKREIMNVLEFAANRASRRVHEAAQADTTKRGMGTTLVAVMILGAQAFIIHVGDSRLYLLRSGKLEQLTDDHNVYNELIKRKKLTREQVTQLAPKNAITRAIGVYESCEPECLVMDIAQGDRFLLCTDGLSEYFEAPHSSSGELGQVLGAGTPEEVVRRLVDTANDRGGKDNITALVVEIGNSGAHDQERLRRLEHQKQVLSRVPLFAHLDDRELRRVLQVMETISFADGERIITESERGESLYIVLSGTVRVVRGEATVKNLVEGEHFGEMALIRNQPRSASVISSGASEMLVMHRTEFFDILRSQPRVAVKLLWQFTGVLADRLAETTRDLGQARVELAAEIEPEDITEELFMVDVVDVVDEGEVGLDPTASGDEDDDEVDDDRLTNKLPPRPDAD